MLVSCLGTAQADMTTEHKSKRLYRWTSETGLFIVEKLKGAYDAGTLLDKKGNLREDTCNEIAEMVAKKFEAVTSVRTPAGARGRRDFERLKNNNWVIVGKSKGTPAVWRVP